MEELDVCKTIEAFKEYEELGMSFITKEEFEIYRKLSIQLSEMDKFIEYLVSEKVREQYSIKHGQEIPFTTTISSEYSIGNDAFSAETERYYCGDTEHEYYEIKSEYLYDKDSMESFRKHVEMEKIRKQEKAKAKKIEEEKKLEDRERNLLKELANKYGMHLTEDNKK